MKTVVEVVRILMRYLAAFLALKGVPPEYIEPLGDPVVINLVAAALTAALAEGGWLRSKFPRQVAM